MKDLKIKKDGKEELYSYQQLRDNHKGHMVAGVALAYRMLEDYLKDLDEGNSFYFYTGMGQRGQGLIDTMELVLGPNLELDTDISKVDDKEAVAGPNGGKYYFELKSDKKAMSYRLKEGLIADDFIENSRKSKQYGDDMPEGFAEELAKSREKLEKAALEIDLDDLFIIEEI